ncbi:hypothetical protein ACH3VR_14065 [Microbacterium sp. B2969]|uniref:Uncharacterized protein n=1 Tax=Microbacterium alkaliflavum TaxID=3248839 RepID=A0ABW7QAV2_9MICO
MTLTLDGFAEADHELLGGLKVLLLEQGLYGTLVAGILELLPDPSTWRLTITNDIVGTVNRLSEPTEDGPYTTDRGAGYVGAITVPSPDGTFDIAMSVEGLLLTAPESASTVEEYRDYVLEVARHLSRHEAGHALLRLRNEHATAFSDAGISDLTEAWWALPLANHIEENRIEQYTATHAPSPRLQVDHLADALGHLRAELNEAKRTWSTDIRAAADRTNIAINDLIRVLAYLAPELGLDDNGRPNRPHPRPEGWNEYIEESWDAWSLTLHELKPVDTPMTALELQGILKLLCRLVVVWMDSIGVDALITEEGQSMYWTADAY